VGNLFELQDLVAQDLKGIAGPVRAWAAVRPASVESRFEAMHASLLTELVGREEELDLLLRRWSKAKTGEGQVVLLSGEPGIGKSRLTAALLERLAASTNSSCEFGAQAMNASETYDFCFARDRETLIRPASERRLKALVQQAVAEVRKLEGAGLSGDDSGLKDIFEEWADQISSQHSVFFELHDKFVWSVCADLVAKLQDAELAVLAAYTDEFDDYSCTEKFIETQSLDGFDAVGAVLNQLYRALETFGVNYIEQRDETEE
jgi:hypothetical protein